MSEGGEDRHGKFGWVKAVLAHPSWFCDGWRRRSSSDGDGGQGWWGSTVTIGLSSLDPSYQPISTLTDPGVESE
jgi:hypothetical protein